MRKLKRLSVTLFITPILFVGCVSEKTSLLKPEVSKEKIVTLENNQSVSKEEKLLASAIFGGQIPTNEESSDGLLTAVKLTLSEVWEAFTKEDEILETAREFLGVKYIWAANGPSAFDCSGFTKYVFKKNGISLPRYSGHQANIGEKIKYENLEKGDLVFFDTEKKFTHKVNHVGIFIGNNKFIHASSAKKKVVITSFTKKKFYKNKFLHARRVVNNNESFALNISTIKKDSLVN